MRNGMVRFGCVPFTWWMSPTYLGINPANYSGMREFLLLQMFARLLLLVAVANCSLLESFSNRWDPFVSDCYSLSVGVIMIE